MGDSILNNKINISFLSFQKVLKPIEEFSKKISELTKPFAKFVETHRETFSQLIQVAQIIQERQPYLDNIRNDLKNPEYADIAGISKYIRLADIFGAIDLEKEADDFFILTVVKSGHVVCKNGDCFYTNNGKEKYLSGLETKLKSVKKLPSVSSTDIQEIEKLSCFKFIQYDDNSIVNKLRNSVMHGSHFSFDEKHSAQLVLWLFSLLLHLQILNDQEVGNG